MVAHGGVVQAATAVKSMLHMPNMRTSAAHSPLPAMIAQTQSCCPHQRGIAVEESSPPAGKA
eukprot:355827-Chlamydomonas_euryale.AAC.15